MASRSYAYYLKGNRIALVEQESSSGGGNLAVAHCTIGGYTTKDTCEAAGGQWIPSSSSNFNGYNKFVSPKTSVSDGLEIEYTYSPEYTLGPSPSTPQQNQFYLNGWTVIDGYLTFLRSHEGTVANWDTSPYNTVGDDEYIVIGGSNRWNGLHKIQQAYSYGVLKTYTKVNQSVPLVTGSSNIDILAESDNKSNIHANDSSNIWLSGIFNTGDYIFIRASGTTHNNGFWEVSDTDSGGTESASGIYVTNRYFCYDGDSTLSTEGIDTTTDTGLTSDESVVIYRAYRDFCYLLSDVTVMQDESFDVDITNYQAKAVVYYIKAKVAEEQMDLKSREYFMREFKRQLEKNSGARKRGPNIVQGNNIMRMK